MPRQDSSGYCRHIPEFVVAGDETVYFDHAASSSQRPRSHSAGDTRTFGLHANSDGGAAGAQHPPGGADADTTSPLASHPDTPSSSLREDARHLDVRKTSGYTDAASEAILAALQPVSWASVQALHKTTGLLPHTIHRRLLAMATDGIVTITRRPVPPELRTTAQLTDSARTTLGLTPTSRRKSAPGASTPEATQGPLPDNVTRLVAPERDHISHNQTPGKETS